MQVQRVEVICRHGTFPGIKSDRVAAYDFEIPAEYPVRGASRTQRCFVLLDEHVQLQRPLAFPVEFEDWWYVDLVHVEEALPTITVTDHWLDIVVPPPGQPYQVRDMEEFGDALLARMLTADQAADGLRRFQAFIDTYLHGPDRPTKHTDLASSWYEFPPAAIASLEELVV